MAQKIFVCDFETSVYEGQTETEVWASALVEIGTEKVIIHNSIEQTFLFLSLQQCNCLCYYHNLKFDGEFWLWYLMKEAGYKQAVIVDNDNPQNTHWLSRKDMPEKSFTYTISDKGQWYSIAIKTEDNFIEIRDSLKLLPFSVKRIGKSFKTKHQKSSIEYVGERHAGGIITDEEREYISNDVLVVKEALEIMFKEGHKKLTIGSCCLAEYKNIIGRDLFKSMFPDLKNNYSLDASIYGSENADEYIRKSYKGGWCYVVRGKENKIKTNGVTCDVNSLYPSMMSSESGNYYPVGYPRFWSGNFIPDKALENNRYYFIRIRTRFYLKKNKLPFIQIKGSFLYNRNECLETSDVRDEETGKYHQYMLGLNGELMSTAVTLTLTCTDYILFREHYYVEDFEILDGCYFNSEIGLFDDYIDKYKKIKLESKDARRELAKLFLNNLYGKLATNDNSSFKLAYDKSEDEIGFCTVPQFDKNLIYIPCGSAITSYARNFTIRAAQANYYGKDKRGFIYADTDSIHCDISADALQGITIHDKNFCCWKAEASWDKAIFARQKTYIEHITAENLTPIETPYYNIKCAGMPDRCKELFNISMTNRKLTQEELNALTDNEREFLFDEKGKRIRRKLTDFKTGLKIPSKLLPKRIKGGVILTEVYFTMTEKGRI